MHTYIKELKSFRNYCYTRQVFTHMCVCGGRALLQDVLRLNGMHSTTAHTQLQYGKYFTYVFAFV